MISIRESVSDLDRCERRRATTLDCYLTAIRNVAHYTHQLDGDTCDLQRKYLTALAGEVASGSDQALEDSRATLRGLLRDYRDKTAAYLERLREELTGTTHALEDILDSLAQTDGDQEGRLRTALRTLREIAGHLSAPHAETLRAATLQIEQAVQELKQQHELAISQFQIGMRMLHRRIDMLESASMVDQLTKLLNRQEIEERIRSSSTDYRLLLARISGIRRAGINYNEAVALELSAAFVKRLRNSLPDDAVMGRWSNDGFVAVLHQPQAQVIALAKNIAEQLSGAYACLYQGKSVRPELQVAVAVVDSSAATCESLMERVSAFLMQS